MCAEDAVESRSSAKPADFQRPPAESLRNASAIWESVADSPSQIAMTPLQQQELDAGYVDYLAHPEDGESWPTVKSQILQSR
jgi:putative addiction module component (TIGR02574 family)